MEDKVMKNLVPVVYANQRVLTNNQIADFYGVEARHIRDNFRHNRKRFIEGVEYFKLEGDELQSFKDKIEVEIMSASVAENFRSQGGYKSPLAGATRSLVLYTKQGAARHCKMLNTPKAWDMFNLLMDNYFNPAPASAIAVPASYIQDELTKLKEEINLLKNQLTKIAFAELAVVYVLLMSNGSVKIGMTQNLTERIKQIKVETGLEVFNFQSTVFMPRDDARNLEKFLIDKYAEFNLGGEFFALRFVDLAAELKTLLA